MPFKKLNLTSHMLFSLVRYSTVVKQTIAIYREMVEIEQWKGQAEVVVKNFRRLPVRVRCSFLSFFLSFLVSPPNCLTLYLVQLTFLTIARCGFGMSFNYAEDANANIDQNNNTTHDMTVEKGLGVISETIVQRLAFPNWFCKLPIQKSVF